MRLSQVLLVDVIGVVGCAAHDDGWPLLACALVGKWEGD